MKKRNNKALAAVLLVVLVLFAGFSYFHVSGKEIASAAAINDDCEVRIVRHDMLASPSFREYSIEGQQIEQLKQLILNSSFSRRLKFLNTNSHDSISYNISIYFHDRQEYLQLNCTGGDFMLVSSSFEEKDHYDLKISSKEWKASLENILESAQLLET